MRTTKRTPFERVREVALAVTAAAALAASASASNLDRLAWLAGSWVSEEEGRVVEEQWMAPRGGVMLGVHRTVEADGGAFFEYLRIVDEEYGVVYVASPRGGEATSFRLVEMGRDRVTFENRDHDFPQRILYWKDVQGHLWARAEGEGRRLEWKLAPAPPPDVPEHAPMDH